jgi:hypothetical protein
VLKSIGLRPERNKAVTNSAAAYRTINDGTSRGVRKQLLMYPIFGLIAHVGALAFWVSWMPVLVHIVLVAYSYNHHVGLRICYSGDERKFAAALVGLPCHQFLAPFFLQLLNT